jgi:hypothetical protein
MTHGLAELGCGRMHYVVAGAGSEIVLLHGRPGFSFDHRHVLPRVAGLGHAVAPDFSGFGDSEAIRGDPVEAAEPDSPAHRREALRARGAARGVVPAPPLPLAEGLIDGDRRRVELYLSYFYEHWGRARSDPAVGARDGRRRRCATRRVRVEPRLVSRASGAARSATGSGRNRGPDRRTLGTVTRCDRSSSGRAWRGIRDPHSLEARDGQRLPRGSDAFTDGAAA